MSDPRDNPGLGIAAQHQNVSVDLAAFPQGDLAHVAALTFVVGGSEKARLPVIATLDDMSRNVR